MKLTILTLFPEFFESPLQASILKRGAENGVVEFNVVNIRDYAVDKHQVTDDRPYGGGPGMVMKVDPIHSALAAILEQDPEAHRLRNLELGIDEQRTRVILTSAKGKVFNQASAITYSKLQHLIIICGHYEGVDERVVEHIVDEEVRIGDFVLTGGEPAALAMADAITRLLPGVLGNEESNVGESHSQPGFLAHPQYTRPVEFKGWKVPEILLSGHQANITDWRQQRTSLDEPLPESKSVGTATDDEASQ